MKKHCPTAVNRCGRGIFLSLLLLALWLTPMGCAQVYSDFDQRTISLAPGDLEQGGIAFITPSTVTGQEEEKQAVALTFYEVLTSERPDIPAVSLAEALSEINASGLSQEYREMYGDYRESGLFQRRLLQVVAKTLNTRYLAQLKLQGFAQDEKDRVQIFGVRIVETKQATLRLFLQIWDAETGTIAWEGLEELRRSRDTFLDEPVTLSDVMGSAGP